jgi:hypothetical protein
MLLTPVEMIKNWERIAQEKKLSLETRQGFWACAQDARVVYEFDRLAYGKWPEDMTCFPRPK